MVKSPNRLREFIGLVVLVGLAIASGMLLESLQGEAHARWFAIVAVVGFLGLALGGVMKPVPLAIVVAGMLGPATVIGWLRGFDAPVGTSPSDAGLLLASLVVGLGAGTAARWMQLRR